MSVNRVQCATPFRCLEEDPLRERKGRQVERPFVREKERLRLRRRLLVLPLMSRSSSLVSRLVRAAVDGADGASQFIMVIKKDAPTQEAEQRKQVDNPPAVRSFEASAPQPDFRIYERSRSSTAWHAHDNFCRASLRDRTCKLVVSP